MTGKGGIHRRVERAALLAVIAVAGWTYGESRAVLSWAHRRLERLEARP